MEALVIGLAVGTGAALYVLGKSRAGAVGARLLRTNIQLMFGLLVWVEQALDTIDRRLDSRSGEECTCEKSRACLLCRAEEAQIVTQRLMAKVQGALAEIQPLAQPEFRELRDKARKAGFPPDSLLAATMRQAYFVQVYGQKDEGTEKPPKVRLD